MAKPAKFNNYTYFMNDTLSQIEHCSSVGIGELWLYFYKENLIGVRDARNDTLHYLDLPIPRDIPISPTAYEITSEIITKSVLDDREDDDETRHILDYDALGLKAKELLIAELAK